MWPARSIHGVVERLVEELVALRERGRPPLSARRRRQRGQLQPCRERLPEGWPASQPGAALAVWGLAYKEDTTSMKNSPSVALLDALNCPARVYDPAAQVPERLRHRVHAATDPLSACEGADLLCVMTPWAEFQRVPLERVAASLRGRTIVDPYGILDAPRAADLGFVHHRLSAPQELAAC